MGSIDHWAFGIIRQPWSGKQSAARENQSPRGLVAPLQIRPFKLLNLARGQTAGIR